MVFPFTRKHDLTYGCCLYGLDETKNILEKLSKCAPRGRGCDKGCGSVLIVFLLTLAGWVPGVIAALNKAKG